MCVGARARDRDRAGVGAGVSGALEGSLQAHGPRDDVLHERLGPGYPISGREGHRAVVGRDGVLLGEPLGLGEN